MARSSSPQPDGSRATREEQERFDIGKLHLEAHDFAGAVRALDGVAITPARNNRALALFHLGRIEEALTGFLDAWQQDAGNLFALGWALRLRLYLGDETGARGLAVPLAQAQARRAEDAYGQISALLLIQENQAAWDAFERSGKTDWVADETGFLGAERLQLGACAASRLGRGDQAEDAVDESPGEPTRGRSPSSITSLPWSGTGRRPPTRNGSTRARPFRSAGSMPCARGAPRSWSPGSTP